LAPDAQRAWTGPAFSFAKDLSVDGSAEVVTVEKLDVLRKWFADWIPDVQAGVPVVVVQVDGAAAAICCSVRQSARAHEAGVETAPEFRGRGFAAMVVAAWAREVRARGSVPLYSTSWENGASRAVARKLGLVQFGSDLHVT
jgi:GNAT superfamily N-acetyltransferase